MSDVAVKRAPPALQPAPRWRNRYFSDRQFVLEYGDGSRETIPAGEWTATYEHDTEELAAIAAEEWLKAEPEPDYLPVCAFVRWLGAVPTFPSQTKQD